MLEIRIKQYTFILSSPYEAGQPLGEEEAQVLNMARGENLREIWSREVEKALASTANGDLLSAEVLADLQARLTAYDQKYRFKPRHRPRAARGGEIAEAAREVAREMLEAQLRHSGQEIGTEAFDALLRDFLELPAVQQEARRRVQDAQRVFVGSLEDLL